MTASPNADNVVTKVEGTEPLGNASSVKSSHQDKVGVKWEKPPEEEHVDSICKCA